MDPKKVTSFISVPTVLLAVFLTVTEMTLEVSALILYTISRIGWKIERKRYD